MRETYSNNAGDKLCVPRELNAARIASLDDRLAQKRVQTLLPDPRQALDLQQTR